jgi:hypothetical protein
MYFPPYITDIHGTVFPPNPFERQRFYRDDLHAWFIFDGTVWVNLQAAGLVPHHLTHELGGADQINVAGLSGLLANPQTPLGHHLTHEPGGADAMAIDAVAGTGSLRTLAGTGVALSAAHSDHTHTLLDDISGLNAPSTVAIPSGTYYRTSNATLSGSDNLFPMSVTPIFAAGSRAVGVAIVHGVPSANNALKLRLYMGGVLVAESAFLTTVRDNFIVVVGFAALSGAQTITANIHNYAGSTVNFYTCSNVSNTCLGGWAVGVGSIKI